jgi:hypothetical protein
MWISCPERKKKKKNYNGLNQTDYLLGVCVTEKHFCYPEQYCAVTLMLQYQLVTHMEWILTVFGSSSKVYALTLCPALGSASDWHRSLCLLSKKPKGKERSLEPSHSWVRIASLEGQNPGLLWYWNWLHEGLQSCSLGGSHSVLWPRLRKR